MISSRRIFLFLTVVSVAFGSDENFGDVVIKPTIIVHEFNLSKTFDYMLPNIQRFMTNNGFDPMPIPDVELALSPFPNFLKTKMHLHRGYVQELSSIYRTGDIILQWTDNRASLYANIGFETLDLSHQYYLKYMLYSKKGDCYGRYNHVNASLLMDYDFKEQLIDLKFFKFTGFGDFKLKFEGNWTDKLFNVLIKAATKIFRPQVLRIIQDRAYSEIQKQIDAFNGIMPENAEIKVKEVEEGLEFKDLVPDEVDEIDGNSSFIGEHRFR